MGTHTVAEMSFRVQEAGPVPGGCTTVRCELSEVLLEPTVVAGAFLLTLACFVAFAYITEARECCREERRRVTDERDAFKEFADRVAALSPSDATGGNGPENDWQSTTGAPAGASSVVGVHGGSAVDNGRDPDLDTVVDAYRETVTAVPHYEEEYDDTVAESLAEELGYDAAVATVSGKTLSSGLQSALVARSRQSRTTRAELLDAIDEELAALDAAESTLSSIDRDRRTLLEHFEEVPRQVSFDAAVDVWRRLSVLERRCDEGVEERQAQLRDPPMDTGDGPPFYEYLYDSLSDTRHPVLCQFTQLADQLRTDRRRIERRLTSAP